MSDEIDTERAHAVAKGLGDLYTEAEVMRRSHETLGDLLASDSLFFVTKRLIDEFVDEVNQTAGSLRLAAARAAGADFLADDLDRRLDELEADINDGVGYGTSADHRRRYLESQIFTGYRGTSFGVADDGVASERERAAAWVLLGQLSPRDAADYWSSLPEEERRALIDHDPGRVAEYVIAHGGTLSPDELDLFERRSIAEASEAAGATAAGALEPGVELPVLGAVSAASTAIAIGDEIVVSINGVAVAGRFVDAAGKVGTAASVGGVIAECADGVDGACAGQAVMFVVDAIGTAVAGPVLYNAVKYSVIGGIVLLGLAQEQSPSIQPDWSGSGGAPGVAPYDGDSVVDAPATGRNDGGAGNGQAGRVMSDAILTYCNSNSDEQVCGWGN